MLRSYEKNLSEWLTRPDRKPLILRGARQVGKSTLVRNFAANHKLKLHDVNLERNPKLLSAFRSLNIKLILQELSFVSNLGAIEPGDILFLDEIQAIPEAITALRYFHEEFPNLPVIAAGSLLEFALTKERVSVPVGRVEYLYIHQLSFEEFLAANQENDLLSFLGSFDIKEPYSTVAHEKLLELFRTYLLLGGMPEVVASYLSDGAIDRAFSVLEQIGETYRDDFSKYSTTSVLNRLQRVLDGIPSRIGLKAVYSKIDPLSQAREVRDCIELLTKAQVVLQAFHSDADGIPLAAQIDDRIYKLYLIDCGLLNSLSGVRKLSIEEIRQHSFINEGKLAEQFIAQHLIRLGSHSVRPRLHYWLREKKQHNAEVDFVVQIGTSVVPVEVKAGESGRMRSLIQFVAQKKTSIAVRFDLAPPSIQQLSHGLHGTSNINYNLISLPLYAVEQLPRIYCTADGA